MTPLAAWVGRRRLTGQPVNGELTSVDPRFQGIFAQMDGAGIAQRRGLFEAFLAGQSDRDAIEDAINAARPDEPAPEPSDERTAEEWSPLRWIDPSAVEPFPTDVLPESAARLVREGSEAIGCPPDFLALNVLVIAGGTIGRSVSLLLKPGYFASSSIWGGVIGSPSRGKTPALKKVAPAVRQIDATLVAQHAQEMEQWELQEAEAAKAKSKPPPKPKPQRIDVDDVTMESLVIILSSNPRGLIMVKDELSAFVAGMDQYKGGKGNDRSTALKLWSGDAITRDRVLNENCPIRCPHPCLSIIGGMTPDMLGSLLDAKGRKDGFIDRFLVSYPDPTPVADWNERGVADATLDAWVGLVGRLWERPMNVKDGENCPHVARFTDQGKVAWLTRYCRHTAEMNAAGFPPDLESAWGKLGEYAGRLTLVLACLWHADDSALDPTAVPGVDDRIVEDAWKLVDYFKSHARRVHATIARGSGIGGSTTVKAIVDWLRDGERSSFTERDIKQARKWITPDLLEEALKYMAERNAVRLVVAPPGNPKGGRPTSPAYDVNPTLTQSQNPQNPQN